MDIQMPVMNGVEATRQIRAMADLPDRSAVWIIALTAYAASIASFLGGIHWGMVFKESDEHNNLHLLWGVSLPLLSWLAVVMPAYAGLPLLGVILIVAYAVDRKSYPSAGLKHWLTLRFRLTVVASLSCFLGAGAT